MDIAVIGSNMVDLITYIERMPIEGETLEASTFEMGCGGKGANQAVAAAKMGSDVMMLSKVGDDMFGENTIANFKNHGIDTTYVEKVTDTASGVAPIFVDSDSNNRILIVKGANQHLSPADIDRAAEKVKQCKLIVLQLEIPMETVYHAIAFGNQHGIPVVLNPAPATKDLDFHAVSKCEFFIPNESELEILTGMPVATKDDVEKAALALVEIGVRHVIVTMGSRGVLWANHHSVEYMDAYAVDAVDTTGAGDAFVGCFVHTFAETGNLTKSIQQASAYAASSVGKRGTQTSYLERAAFLDWERKLKYKR